MGLFTRRRPAEPPIEPEFFAHARRVIGPGFVTRADAVEAVRDHFGLDDTDRRAESAVAQAWREQSVRQRNWDGPGDHDRLTAAFDRLGRRGVLARMNFACCQNCGTDEIDDERTPLDDAAAGSYPWREWAYTFFHQQDAERLGDGPGVLFLSYSAFRASRDLDPAVVQAAREGDPEARRRVRVETDRQVGGIVTAELRAQGLAVQWDGDPGERIRVMITEWRRPLPD